MCILKRHLILSWQEFQYHGQYGNKSYTSTSILSLYWLMTPYAKPPIRTINQCSRSGHGIIQLQRMIWWGQTLIPWIVPSLNSPKVHPNTVLWSLSLTFPTSSWKQIGFFHETNRTNKNDRPHSTPEAPLPPSNLFLSPRWAPWHGWPLPQLQRAKC